MFTGYTAFFTSDKTKRLELFLFPIGQFHPSPAFSNFPNNLWHPAPILVVLTDKVNLTK